MVARKQREEEEEELRSPYPSQRLVSNDLTSSYLAPLLPHSTLCWVYSQPPTHGPSGTLKVQNLAGGCAF